MKLWRELTDEITLALLHHGLENISLGAVRIAVIVAEYHGLGRPLTASQIEKKLNKSPEMSHGAVIDNLKRLVASGLFERRADKRYYLEPHRAKNPQLHAAEIYTPTRYFECARSPCAGAGNSGEVFRS
jgi:hypothetical protein